MASESGHSSTIAQPSTPSTLTVSNLFPSITIPGVIGISGGAGTGLATTASTTSTLTSQGSLPTLPVPTGDGIESEFPGTGSLV